MVTHILLDHPVDQVFAGSVLQFAIRLLESGTSTNPLTASTRQNTHDPHEDKKSEH